MKFQYLRIFLGGVLLEAALLALAVPIALTGHESWLVYVVPPACLVFSFVVTLWIGRGFRSHHAAQGALVGLLGIVIYLALTRAEAVPWQYVLGHALKVLGGAAGAVVAQGRVGLRQEKERV